MADPVRLFSPNPDAPTSYGGVDTLPRASWIDGLVQAASKARNPFGMAWDSLPPNVRDSYKSGVNAVAELSPGAAVRDVVDASGEVGHGILNADPRRAGLGLASMLTAAAGVIPAGGMASKLPVRPAFESARDVADAAFKYAADGARNKTVPIASLSGTMSAAADDAAKVASLKQKIAGPDGYIERLIVDDAGNVLEGQHRLNALRELGHKTAPVTVVEDLARGHDVDAMENAVRSLGPIRSDHVRGIVRGALESVKGEGGAAQALSSTSLGGGWQAHYEAALRALMKNK